MAENEKNKVSSKNSKTNLNKKNVKKGNNKKKVNTTKTNTSKEATSIKKTTESKEVVKVEKVKEEQKTIKNKKEKKDNIKQARRQLYYNENNDSNEFSKLIKIVLTLTVIILIFYGVTVVVTNKAEEAAKKENAEKAEIQYDSIVIGSMLDINGTFYVLIEDEDDIRLNEYTTLVQTISASEDAPKIYTADLSSGFNKKYLSDEVNYDSDMTKFRVKETTLVKVSDHKITNVYDNYDAIKNELSGLDEVK